MRKTVLKATSKLAFDDFTPLYYTEKKHAQKIVDAAMMCCRDAKKTMNKTCIYYIF